MADKIPWYAPTGWEPPVVSGWLNSGKSAERRRGRVANQWREIYGEDLPRRYLVENQDPEGFREAIMAGLDEFGYSPSLPGKYIAPDVQLAAENKVARRNDRLMREAIERGNVLFGDAKLAQRTGLGTLGAYRPGGAAEMTSGFYQSLANTSVAQADFELRGAAARRTDAPDLMFRKYEDAKKKLEAAAKKSGIANLVGTTIGTVAGAYFGGPAGASLGGALGGAVAGAAAPAPGGGAPAMGPGMIGGGQGSPLIPGGAGPGGAGGGVGFAGSSGGGGGGGGFIGPPAPSGGGGGGGGGVGRARGAGGGGGGGEGAGAGAGAGGAMLPEEAPMVGVGWGSGAATLRAAMRHMMDPEDLVSALYAIPDAYVDQDDWVESTHARLDAMQDNDVPLLFPEELDHLSAMDYRAFSEASIY